MNSQKKQAKTQQKLRTGATEMSIEFLITNALLVLLMITASLVAVLLRDLIAAAIALAAMSLLLSLEFYLLQAPDVAIAQAGVGACLTTAIIIITIKATKRLEEE
jgi:energy-converting hydrogenase B subunit D